MNVSRRRQILQLALPLILQQLCLQMQLWIDRAMLGHFNAAFFSAIGNASIPYHMITSAITAVCGGTAILVAHSIGARDLPRAREISEASFFGNTILSSVAFLIFFFGSGKLFQVMGVQSPILEYSVQYIRILSVSLLLLGPSVTASAVLQGLGLTKIIMITGIAGNLMNIFLDWLFIFGNLGFPALGIQGAALATVLSNTVSAVLTVSYVLFHPRMSFRVRGRQIVSGNFRCYRQILVLGIPSGVEYALWNIGNVVLVSFLNRLDIMSAGIYTLVFSIETVPMLIYMGFANAGLTLVGQQTGARNPRQARQTGLLCLGFSLAVCVIIAVVFHSIPRQLLGLFTNDPEILNISVPYLVFVSWILFPKAVNNVIGLCIRGMGDTRWMLYTQIFGSAFMILCGYCLILRSPLGLSGIFITLLCDEGIRSVLNLWHFLSSGRSSKIQAGS